MLSLKNAVRSSILSVFFLLLISSMAHAVPIQCTFTGEITAVSGPAALSSEIFAGSQFYGGFVYDNENPIVYDGSPDTRTYNGPGDQIAITFVGQNGTYTINSGLSAGIIVTNAAHDEMYFYVTDWLDGNIAGVSPVEASLTLKDSSGSTFSSPDLPGTLSTDSFDQKKIWLVNNIDPMNGFELQGEIKFLNAIPTPEPASMLLIGFGGLAMVYERKRAAARKKMKRSEG